MVVVDGESSAVSALHSTNRCSTIISKPSIHISVYKKDLRRWMLILKVWVELMVLRVGEVPQYRERSRSIHRRTFIAVFIALLLGHVEGRKVMS